MDQTTNVDLNVDLNEMPHEEVYYTFSLPMKLCTILLQGNRSPSISNKVPIEWHPSAYNKFSILIEIIKYNVITLLKSNGDCKGYLSAKLLHNWIKD